jgi:DNA repair exonuclease SbcCD ATPase subunit
MATLKWFKCKGSQGVYYGLGKEEIAINFENMSGLITLAGENGNGKTSVMEMLSPFDTMPSRKLKNPKKYNLKNQFRDRNSYKEVCYQFDGSEYIFRVEIPAGTTMGIEGYITCDGVPLVKGKISEYRKKVVELFGSEDLFYSSIFSCQGGEKLTDKTVGEFKQLLIELLGLNKYVLWWKNIGAVLTEIQKELDKVLYSQSLFSGKQEEIEKNKVFIAGATIRLEAEQTELSDLYYKIDLVKKDIKRLETDKKEAEVNKAILKEKKDQRIVYFADLSCLKDERADITFQHTNWLKLTDRDIAPSMELVESSGEILAAEENVATLGVEKAEWEKELVTINKGISEKQEALNKVSAEYENLLKEKVGLSDDQNLKSLSKAVGLAQEEKEGAKAITLSLADDLYKAKDESVLKMLEKTLAGYQDAETLLSKRPDKCVIDDCPFIMNALEATKNKAGTEAAIKTWKSDNKTLVDSIQARLQSAQEKEEGALHDLSKIKDEWKERSQKIEEAMKDIQIKLVSLGEDKEALQDYLSISGIKKRGFEDAIAAFPERVKEFTALASQKDDLRTAQQLVSASQKLVEEKKYSFLKAVAGIERKEEAIEKKIKDLDIESMERSIGADQIIERVLLSKEKENDTLNREAKTRNIHIADIEKEIAVLEDKAKMSDLDKSAIISLEESEKHIRKEMSKWEYSRAAVSKSGLQALEIASAAPLLTGIANELLSSAFGGSLCLDLVTIDPDTGSEILDIYVTREDGQTFPLAEYSGGESVYILQAFKCAQIVVNIEKSGVHFQTAFADEESSALDKDKSEKFIQLYRALLNRAGFEKLIYITHMPEAQALADHSIEFTKDGLKSESDIEIVA